MNDICPFCYEQVSGKNRKDKSVTLPCKRRCCRKCLVTYAKNKIATVSIIKCPFIECSDNLNLKGILSPTLIASYNNNINYNQCPKSNCSGRIESLKCTKCSILICGKCEAIEHPNIPCHEHNRLSFQLIKKECLRCPHCNVKIYKDGGCENMACTRCHNGFKWGTPYERREQGFWDYVGDRDIVGKQALILILSFAIACIEISSDINSNYILFKMICLMISSFITRSILYPPLRSLFLPQLNIKPLLIFVSIFIIVFCFSKVAFMAFIIHDKCPSSLIKYKSTSLIYSLLMSNVLMIYDELRTNNPIIV